MSTYKVVDGTQVNHGGVLLRGGDTFDADPEVASPWLAGGLVVEVDAKTERAARKKPAKAPAIR